MEESRSVETDEDIKCTTLLIDSVEAFIGKAMKYQEQEEEANV